MNNFQLIVNEVKKAVNGKDRAIVTSLLAILANGNILIEDIPGVGKTTMAVAFSKALGLKYNRFRLLQRRILPVRREHSFCPIRRPTVLW